MLPETRENETESKADFWQRHIEVCNRSSLTQAQYCRQHFLDRYKELSIALSTQRLLRFNEMVPCSRDTCKCCCDNNWYH